MLICLNILATDPEKDCGGNKAVKFNNMQLTELIAIHSSSGYVFANRKQCMTEE